MSATRRRWGSPRNPKRWTRSISGALSIAFASGCMIHRVRPVGPPGPSRDAVAEDRARLRPTEDGDVVTTAAQAEAGPVRPPSPPEGAEGPRLPTPLPPEEASAPDAPLIPEGAAVPAPAREYPIDLSTALRLADAENPRIAESRTSILQAVALQKGARALLLPSLNLGVTYHGHNGNLQRSSGRILSLSEQSLYVGGGARTLAAETVGVPAVNITSPITEALYEPLAARRNLEGARFRVSATANAVLLEVATLHLDLIAAEATLEMRRRSEAEAREILRTVASFGAAGRGRQANTDRAETELRLLRAEVQRTEGEVAIASARLSRRLNLDPSVRLRPLTGPVEPIELVDPRRPTEELLGIALNRRPEMGATTADIGVAEAKYREERARPFLPTLWLGFSGGGFGGGSNLVPPLLGNFGGRSDFDVRAYWTLQNFGFGNLALQKRRLAQVGQAQMEQARTVNKIRREVASAQAVALTQIDPIEQARRALATSEAGFREDLTRTRNGEGRPIEVLNSLNLLTESRIALIRAITVANQAQFALFVSLGTPPPVGPAAPPPSGPPPIASPLRSPFVSGG